jgi:hypothetical protein
LDINVEAVFALLVEVSRWKLFHSSEDPADLAVAFI